MNPMMAQMGMLGNQFTQLRDFLVANYNIESVDLGSGRVPSIVDVLMVVDPSNLGERELFAIDQFLMRGGTVMLASSPFETQFRNETILASNKSSGLSEWLTHYGITMEETLVMDPRNAAFPVPVTRQVGSFSFQEIRLLVHNSSGSTARFWTVPSPPIFPSSLWLGLPPSTSTPRPTRTVKSRHFSIRARRAGGRHLSTSCRG